MYHDEEDYDAMHYDLEITFNVRIAKWRIDDPRDRANHEWSLSVFDRNLERWVNINDLNRPGEYGMLSKMVLVTDKPMSIVKVERGPVISGAQRTLIPEGNING